ncbi:MAG: glycosyltransferase [Methanosphaera sp.]|nr:glycosyltransferase [Methanosphaera sp.]
MQPKVSIIIPIYNTEKYLDRCMQSVLSQTLKDIEIILVDDESPDNAPMMCDDYAKQDSRIKVIHKKNGGLGFARNSGLEIASGEYVAYLDSDDYVEENMYQQLYETAKEQSYDVVLCGNYFVDRFGRKSTNERMIPYKIENEVLDVLFATLGAPTFTKQDNILGMSVWGGIYSMELIQKYAIRFPSERQYICEDAIYHIDFFHHAKSVKILNEPLYNYCNNPGSLSRTFRTDRYEKDKILYKKEYEMLNDYNTLNIGKTYIDRMFLTFVRVYLTEVVYNLSFINAIQEIKKTMSDDLLKDITKSYPYKENPMKQRIFNKSLKDKNWLLAFLLLKFAAYKKKDFYQE